MTHLPPTASPAAWSGAPSRGLAPGQLHLQGVDPGGIPLLLGDLLQLLLILTHLLEDLRPPVLLPSVLIVASLR